MNRFPFSVVFVDTSDSVVVLALAHHRKKPDYWSGRIADAEAEGE